MPELRQQPRVVFSAKARIHPEGDDESVVARIHNLSANGIYVTAPRALRRGARVKCRMFLGEEGRVLRGRVAWTEPGDATVNAGDPASRNGAGIHFTDVSPADAALLERLVSPRPQDERPAEIQLAGMPAPVRCRAVVTRDGLRIVTRLPFLRLGSDLKVTFENRGVRESRTGRLDALVLAPSGDDPVPRLLLSISTPDVEEAEGTIESQGATHSRGSEALEFVPSTLIDEEALSPPSGPMTTGYTTDIDLSYAMRPERSEPTQRVAMPAPPPRARSSATTRVIVAAAAVGALMVVAGMILRMPRRHASPSAAAPAMPTARDDRTATRGGSPVVEPMPAPTAPGQTAAGSSNAAANAVSNAAIQIRVNGAQTELFVPLAGSTRLADHRKLTSPAGIAVNVPYAQPLESEGRHVLSSAAVSQVWVDRKNVGTQIRVLFSGPIAQSDVQIERQGVRFKLLNR